MSHYPYEFTLLWQEGMMAEPDLASIKRFDGVIARRNMREYLTGIVMLCLFGWWTIFGEDRLQNGVSFACIVFVLAYLWWQHRHMTPLDSSADARAYHRALVARIDQQIQLLKSVRYWYLLPLYVPPVWQAVDVWNTRPVVAIVGWIVITMVFVYVGHLNERVGVRWWMAEREKIELNWWTRRSAPRGTQTARFQD